MTRIMIVLIMYFMNCMAEEKVEKVVPVDVLDGGEHPKHLPHLVYLDIATPNGNTTCSGSVVHGRWILTAAHCVLGSTTIHAYAGLTHEGQPAELKNSKVQMRVSEKYIINPYFMNEWSSLGLNFVYDFALIKLKRSFNVDNITVRAVEMDDTAWGDSLARRCKVAGFGSRMRGGRERSAEDSQLYLAYPTVRHGLGACPCYRKGWLVGSALCYPAGPGASCPGDSGSPLLCGRRQTGISSHIYYGNKCDLLATKGEETNGDCGTTGYYIVYMYVCPVLGWLRWHVGTIIPKRPTYC